MINNKILFRYILYVFILLLGTEVFADTEPVFYAHFKANESSNVVESSANHFRGKILNTIQYKQGDMKKVDFDGLCTYIYSETSNSGIYYNLKSDFLSKHKITISFWTNINNVAGSSATLIDIVNSKNSSIFRITTDSSQRKVDGLSVIMNSTDGKTLQYIDNGKALDINKWVQITISFDENTGKMLMYLNGGLYKKISFSKSTIFKDINKIFIGRSYDGNTGLLGSIDEVLIYDTIITSKNVKKIYDDELNRLNIDGSKMVCQKKVCVFKEESSSDPIADIFGKLVFTKNKFIYSCTTISEERGSCKTSNKNEKYNMPKYKKNGAYINTFAGGRLEEIATIASAESFANKIMSGWKGYCEKGLKGDFSWASDPYFWGSVALSFASSSIGSTASDTASKEAATQMFKESAAGTLTKESEKQAVKEALKRQLYRKMAKYMVCASQAGLDIGKMMQNDKIPCDPVDQICTDPKSRSYDDQTYTLSVKDYNDMLTKDPDYVKYISVISNDGSYVSFFITYPKGGDTSDSKAAQKAREKAKKTMQDIQGAMIGFTAASCGVSVATGGNAATSSSTGSNDNGFSAMDAGKMLLQTGASLMCGPPCGAAAQIVGAMATSWTNVNSCKSKSDAKTAGSRHLETLKANNMGLCKATKTVCVQKDATGQGCQLHGYYFCCYDTMLTKILAEQVKAQYALGWEHCTGISLSEFMHISFKSCGDAMNKNGAIDGTMLPYGSTSEKRLSAVQSADKCIDYTKYISYIKQLTGDRFGSAENIKDLLIK